MRKDVREFIRRLEAVGLTVESTPGHYRVLRDGEPLRKANGMPFMLPFSPDTIRSALILYGSFARAGAALLSQDELNSRLQELEQGQMRHRGCVARRRGCRF
jgi:hypothetical protein